MTYLKILLSHGAKINIFDKEKVAAPLFCAVASGSGTDSEAVVDLLMKNGADINLGLSLKLVSEELLDFGGDCMFIPAYWGS